MPASLVISISPLPRTTTGWYRRSGNAGSISSPDRYGLTLFGIAVAGLAVVAGLPPVYGLVIVTTVCALFELVRRRIFAHWSAEPKAEADALVWSEAFLPHRDRLT